VVLTHATGHILSAYAGAIKNIAMGLSSKASKQIQHSSLKPHVIKDKCRSCGCCITICPALAVSLKNMKASIDSEKCLGCGECLCACKFDAIFINWNEEAVIFCRRMVDVSGAILGKLKNKVFINLAFDITKECDCISTEKDEMIIDDVGILVSNDVVSIDKATVDMATKSKDVFLKAQGSDVYKAMLEYAEEKGLGTSQYNIIEL